MPITKEKYVTIAYDFSTPDGQLLGTSGRQGPLTFCAGSGDILVGLDTRLQGHEIGDDLSFVIPAEEAYGLRDETLVTQLSKTELDATVSPQIGTRVQAQIGGRWRVALITEINESTVTADANHPLAGIPLHFNCTVLSIEDTPPAGCGCGSGGGCCSSNGGGCSSEGGGDCCGEEKDSSSGGCGSGGCGCGH